jgi:5-formyltetrahydrofolate cyclo-ligase
MGKRVVLPKVNVPDWRLMLYEIKNIKELKKGYMDIPEPSVTEDRLRNIDDIDVFIIPGIAFDESGNRLGYSSGLYDKLLSGIKQSVPIVALAYEEQIVEKIFSEPHDVKMHKIITEKRIIECK